MADQEKCPKCGDGLLYVVREGKDYEALDCLSCGNHISRPKEGYEVREPGAPITPIEKGKGKGGES